MGFRKERKATHRLTFDDPEYAGLEVEIGPSTMSAYFDMAELTALTDGSMSPEDLIKIKSAIGGFADSVVSWNIDDAEGNPLPVSAESVLSLDIDFITTLLRGWAQAVGGIDADLKGLSNSGANFPDLSIPMMPAPPSASLPS